MATPEGMLKINVDASVLSFANYVGIGAVAQDHLGTVLAATSLHISGRFSPHIAECLAIKEGVKLAQAQGFSARLVESNAFNVVVVVRSPPNQALGANIVQDIKTVLIQARCGSVYYISCEDNDITHTLVGYTMLLLHLLISCGLILCLLLLVALNAKTLLVINKTFRFQLKQNKKHSICCSYFQDLP